MHRPTALTRCARSGNARLRHANTRRRLLEGSMRNIYQNRTANHSLIFQSHAAVSTPAILVRSPMDISRTASLTAMMSTVVDGHGSDDDDDGKRLPEKRLQSDALLQILSNLDEPPSNAHELVQDAWELVHWWTGQRTIESVHYSVELYQALSSSSGNHFRSPNKRPLGNPAWMEEDDEENNNNSNHNSNNISNSVESIPILLQRLIVNWSLAWQQELVHQESNRTGSSTKTTTASSLPTPQQLWEHFAQRRRPPEEVQNYQHNMSPAPLSFDWNPTAINWLIRTAIIIHEQQQQQQPKDDSRSLAEFLTRVVSRALDHHCENNSTAGCYKDNAGVPGAPWKQVCKNSLTRSINLTLKTWKQYAARMNGSTTDDDNDNNDEILSTMQALLDRARRQGLASTVTYNTVLGTLGPVRGPDAAEALLLEWVEAYFDADDTVPTPDLVSVHCCLKAWAQTKSHRKTAGNNAENSAELANRCLGLFGKLQDPTHYLGRLGLRPSTTTFNILMHAWSRQLPHMSPKQAAESARLTQVLLDEMRRTPARITGDHDFETDNFDESSFDYHNPDNNMTEDTQREELLQVGPDVVSYTTALNVFAKAGQGQMAQDLLDNVYRQYMDQGMYELRPSSRMHTSLLEAWSRSSHPDRVARAEAAWDRWHELSVCGLLPAPTTTAYNVMMQSYLRTGKIDAAREFVQVRMQQDGVEPDQWTYGPLIFATVRSDPQNAGKKALEILMEAVNRNVVLDINAWNAVIASLARGGHLDEAEDLLQRLMASSKTDDLLYTGKIKSPTYGPLLFRMQFNRPNSAPQIDSLVRQLEGLYHSGVLEEPVTADAYQPLVIAWAKYTKEGRSKAAAKAEEVLQFLRAQAALGYADMEPDSIAYHSVMRVHCQSGSPHRAERLLKQMLQSLRDRPETAARPVVGMFASILLGYSTRRRSAGSDSARRAIELMYKMEKLSIAPTTECYELVLSSLAWSRDPERAQEMQIWLDRMIRHHKLATPKAYRFVVDAWLRCAGIHLDRVLDLWESYGKAVVQRNDADANNDGRSAKLLRKIEAAVRDDGTEKQQERLQALLESQK